ncbi:class I SAM-dependent methyltransferase [Parahaliea mediterranea]|uniref:class I SAM-dependent methyltransferase n=1 Tax=Parahaliea mediterranea TaxID=651086 RepID=UPI001F49EC0D|nr:class I SAM-dependent methyltransferase [Parahaliea mediterranea]
MDENHNSAALAGQLRCPHGSEAVAIGARMARNNAGPITQAIDWLAPANGDRVLEVGPGSGAHIPLILERGDAIRYQGLDLSAPMVAEAVASQGAWIETGRARFQQGSSEAMPFADAAFDSLLCVNTLYFWERPQDHLAEMRRVLRPGGRLCLAYGDRDFMSALPFSRHGFRLYGRPQGEALLAVAGFDTIEHRSYCETGGSNSGGEVQKRFHLLRARRPVLDLATSPC